jgi:hypothetical protein
MAPKSRDGDTVASVCILDLRKLRALTHTVQFSGKWISYSHTLMAYSMWTPYLN